MAVPLFRGKPYNAIFSATINTPVSEGSSISISGNSLKKLNFDTGNTVVVSAQSNPTNRFEGIVSSYDRNAGTMTISEVTNIRNESNILVKGNFGGPRDYSILLSGERGSKIFSNTATPASSVGRLGDYYIEISTGKLYIKS